MYSSDFGNREECLCIMCEVPAHLGDREHWCLKLELKIKCKLIRDML